MPCPGYLPRTLSADISIPGRIVRGPASQRDSPTALVPENCVGLRVCYFSLVDQKVFKLLIIR
jgi:hypothetical protein